MDRKLQAAAGAAGLAAAAAAGAIVGRRTAHRGANGGAPEQDPDPLVEGYCVKERKKVWIQGAVQTTMKNGRPAIRGECPDCGTKIFKFGTLAPA